MSVLLAQSYWLALAPPLQWISLKLAALSSDWMTFKAFVLA
jgi:hypothetical protein